MSDILQQDMLLSNDNIQTKFSISESARTNDQKIANLLEKIGLTIDTEHSNFNGLPGLGTSNIMSMACELLLRMTGHEHSQFLLIEEPEAHIHPQRQMKLMKSFEKDASAGNRQIILTTHSPLLASAAKLDDVIVMKDDHPYPLNHQSTKLVDDDYQYLERFLDATKANLFFARGVLIVEGAGEELLLPTISRLLNRDFSDYGVSIVNVGGKGFSRYARIFLRQDNKPMGVQISCITDRDIRPDQYASFVEKSGGTVPAQNRRNWKLESEVSSKPERETKDQDVRTFLSNQWTLEYDLAFYGLGDSSMAQCLFRAMSRTTTSKFLVDKAGRIEEAVKKFDDITMRAIRFHQYFGSYSKAIFAQALAGELATEFSNKPDQLRKCLPPYLVAAIEYVTEVN
jgi:putative ATP-dependent endonuclease of OLD family